jgi:NADPH:quinone reductase-like Zn-dependent oxidoreductase
MVRSIGADHVIDYKKEDFLKSGKQYDLIVATAGYRSIYDYRRALSRKGFYVCTGGAWSQIFQALLLAKRLTKPGGKTFGILTMNPDFDFATLRDMIEAGNVKSVIDRCYPMAEIGEAFTYYGTRHARGKVVITI